jgi:hypothetical protein
MEVRVSLASDGPYDAPYQRFEYRGQPKNPVKQPQVFERLYQESDIRRRNQMVNSLSSPKFVRPHALQEGQRDHKEDISRSLLRKHAESQARLSRLRAEKDLEEAALLQPAPRINPNSKDILEKARRLSAALPPPVSVHDPTRSYGSVRSSQERAEIERNVQESPSEVRLRIPQIKAQVDTHSTIQRLLDQRRKARKQPSQESRMADNIATLREAAQGRSQTLEHQEPPDLLDMDVVDRNDVWLKQKQAKIAAAQEKKKDGETLGCTFRPNLRLGRKNSLTSQLSERRLNSTSVSSTRSRSNSRNRSYAELHSAKVNSSYSKRAVVSPPASKRVREEILSPRAAPVLATQPTSKLTSPRAFTPRQARPGLTRVESASTLQKRPSSKPRPSKLNEKQPQSPRYNELSPAKRIYSFSSGFNVRDFIQRAQALPKYEEPAKTARR